MAAAAAAVSVNALNSVDLPTFGSPTIPHLKPMARAIAARARLRYAACMATAYAFEPGQRSGAVRFTADEFLDLEELGAFQGRKIELTRGHLWEEPLPGLEHGRLQIRIGFLLTSALASTAVVVGELSVRLTNDTVRDFDVGLVRPGLSNVRAVRPADVLLACEIAVTTLPTDLGVKAREYGRAGIPVYWVADAAGGQMHVMEQPGLDGYASRRAVPFGEPLPVPGGGTIVVAS